MITRIEIDGFKSFKDFVLDVPPLLAVTGANSSGKSNLIDALRLLAGASHDHRVVFRFDRGNAVQLLRHYGNGGIVDRFRIAVDLSVPSEAGALSLQAAVVAELGPLAAGQARPVEPAPLAFEARFLGDIEPKERRAALNAELDSWLFLAPSPDRLRTRAPGTDRGRLASDASNLAAVLGRLAESGALPELLLDLRAVIPTLDDVLPVQDHRGDWDFDLAYRDSGRIAPSMASDGTLRVLAVLAAVHDAAHPGTIVIDEVENGLHPGRLATLLELLAERIAEAGARRQMIMTTHSPVVLSHMLSTDRDAVLFLDSVLETDVLAGVPVGSMVTRARGVRADGPRGTYVTAAEVRRYLETVRQDVR
ncbi:ATP-binding protein [Kitasatospora sp. NBC_01287]|uniref:AAA family ATPase n=1 Tax=Kitasatospora sp. NBC_01287 TaxID=2903573 RepID=UPI00225B8C3E|nr:ATP-binding protein [Kitasatospora sp. NBC_01287]MCX4746636.1 ATP-binding protein [Kitasatospora sp. NBC_01287]